MVGQICKKQAWYHRTNSTYLRVHSDYMTQLIVWDLRTVRVFLALKLCHTYLEYKSKHWFNLSICVSKSKAALF